MSLPISPTLWLLEKEPSLEWKLAKLHMARPRSLIPRCISSIMEERREKFRQHLPMIVVICLFQIFSISKVKKGKWMWNTTHVRAKVQHQTEIPIRRIKAFNSLLFQWLTLNSYQIFSVEDESLFSPMYLSLCTYFY